MLNFNCDYSEGAHPRIIEALVKTNTEQTVGYGNDAYCDEAKRRIRSAIGNEELDVELFVGGTQVNLTAICGLLRSYEGVVAPVTGHIAVHEGGAIEATGHKVITLPERDGKLVPDMLKSYFEGFYADSTHDFMPRPGLVYLSHPTEYGTLYTKSELTAISKIAHEFGAMLYLDGARLGYALATPENELSLSDIADLCDAFYIGGTKCGALFGEALVMKKGIIPHFTVTMKQKGAILAKGRLLGIQFCELFDGNTYVDICKTAIASARRIREALIERGYELLVDSPTNQIFPIVSADKFYSLSRDVVFSVWEPLSDDRYAIRFVTSFMTCPEQVDELIALL